MPPYFKTDRNVRLVSRRAACANVISCHVDLFPDPAVRRISHKGRNQDLGERK